MNLDFRCKSFPTETFSANQNKYLLQKYLLEILARRYLSIHIYTMVQPLVLKNYNTCKLLIRLIFLLVSSSKLLHNEFTFILSFTSTTQPSTYWQNHFVFIALLRCYYNPYMICLYSDYSLRMSKYINTSKKYINDPALRCCHYYGTDRNNPDAVARRAYEESSVLLPSIWSWKLLPHFYAMSMSNATIFERRDRTPYYPFNKLLYEFATGARACSCTHTLPLACRDTNVTYNFPCGCENPPVSFVDHPVSGGKPTSALLSISGIASFEAEVPRFPVFAQGAAPKIRKRKKSKLSLTDNRTYSRLVRSRSTKAAKPAKGCSVQLMEEEDPTDSD